LGSKKTENGGGTYLFPTEGATGTRTPRRESLTENLEKGHRGTTKGIRGTCLSSTQIGETGLKKKKPGEEKGPYDLILKSKINLGKGKS